MNDSFETRVITSRLSEANVAVKISKFIWFIQMERGRCFIKFLGREEILRAARYSLAIFRDKEYLQMVVAGNRGHSAADSLPAGEVVTVIVLGLVAYLEWFGLLAGNFQRESRGRANGRKTKTKKKQHSRCEKVKSTMKLGSPGRRESAFD